MAGKWVGEPKEAMENAMTERVNELSERLHTPVRIIRTEEEVAALPSVRQRRMKGSFNPMNGEVTIVVPNNANMADIENTFVHEVVGHDGLRVLFPDEAKLNNALDIVNLEFVPSPLPLSPTTKPYPISWLSLTPTVFVKSLICIAKRQVLKAISANAIFIVYSFKLN